MRNTAAAVEARRQQETQDTPYGALFLFPGSETEGMMIQAPMEAHISCRAGTGQCVLTHLSDAEGHSLDQVAPGEEARFQATMMPNMNVQRAMPFSMMIDGVVSVEGAILEILQRR